jgi:hypothetical protein
VREILDLPVLAVGSIVERPHPLADHIKTHPRIQLQQVTQANRHLLPHQINTVLRPSRVKGKIDATIGQTHRSKDFAADL